MKLSVIVSTIIGIALFLLERQPDSSLLTSLSDLLFSLGSGFLLTGLYLVISNLHMFDSFTWGMKRFHRMMRGQKGYPNERDTYLEYRAKRGNHPHGPVILGISAILLALSAVLAFVFLKR